MVTPDPPQGSQYLCLQGGGHHDPLLQEFGSHCSHQGAWGPPRWAWGAWCSRGERSRTSACVLRGEGAQREEISREGGWEGPLPPPALWHMVMRGRVWGPHGASRGGWATHSGWQTRRPGSQAGRWWPGTVARPAREDGPVALCADRPAQGHRGLAPPSYPAGGAQPSNPVHSPSLLVPPWALAAPEGEEKEKSGQQREVNPKQGEAGALGMPTSHPACSPHCPDCLAAWGSRPSGRRAARYAGPQRMDRIHHP